MLSNLEVLLCVVELPLQCSELLMVSRSTSEPLSITISLSAHCELHN